MVCSARMNSSGSQPAPQFGKAEYIGEPGTDQCSSCGKLIGRGQEYYRIKGTMTCATCTELLRGSCPKDSHTAFMRALLFGMGAAVVGLIGYSVFGIVTGLMIGYVSLAVGYIVGKAMMFGSKGVGGRRYQITALLLTYAAVSLSAVPVAVSVQAKQKISKQEQAAKVAEEQRQLEREFGQQPQQFPSPVTPPRPAAKQISIGAAFTYLALLGLASPFLALEDPLHGFIGLIILLVGIRIAWQITSTKLPEITGPFASSKS